MLVFLGSLILTACTLDYDETLYTLTITSDIEITYSVTPEGDYSENTEVEITLDTYQEGYEFLEWNSEADGFLSDDKSFTLTITDDTTIEAVFSTIEEDDNDDLEASLVYYTGFEDGEKAAYADDSVILSDASWLFKDALIGGLDNDQTVDQTSTRIRQGYIETEFSIAELYSVRFQYGHYLSDDPSEISFYVSSDRNTWIQVGDSFTASDELELFELIFNEALFDTYDFTSDDSLYFRIDNSENTERVNIDEFKVFAFGEDIVDDDIDDDDSNDTDDDDSNDKDENGDTANGEYDHDLLNMELDEYYASVEGLYGDDLIEGLNALMWETLEYENYGAARYILAETDKDPNNSDNVIQLYTRDSVTNEWTYPGDEVWNREHVWPQSALSESTSGNTSRGQGSDLHNLAPADPNENQLRGNKAFDEAGNSVTYTPHDDAKGMVARIMLYMDIMYDDLTLVSSRSPQLDDYEMGHLEYLLSWHDTFEVSDFEENRNDIIDTYQQNRNPFIDYPHFAALIWYDYYGTFE